MIAFRSVLLEIPLVFFAAAANFALIIGSPAPGALRLLWKKVTCFLAATAIIIVPPGPPPAIANAAGLMNFHFAAMVLTKTNYATVLFNSIVNVIT